MILMIHVVLPSKQVFSATDVYVTSSEYTSNPKNPRTNRAYGYAFIDLSDPSEAERAIAELSSKKILDRTVSVQLACKPEPVRSAVVGQDRTAKDTKTQSPRVLREKSKHRPPPASGIPSKTTVMISNLAYDLNEEKVSDI
jgi:RNA recognition motif-containing protein